METQLPPWRKHGHTPRAREELTLEGLLRDQHSPVVGGHSSKPAVKLVCRGTSTTEVEGLSSSQK